MYCNKCRVALSVFSLTSIEMRDVETGEKHLGNSELTYCALLAGDNRCIWGKKDRIMYCAKKFALSVR